MNLRSHVSTVLFVVSVFPALLLNNSPLAQSPSETKAGQPQAGVGLQRAFPKLRFDRPVYLGGARDGSDRIFVAEQAGVIRVFDANENVDPDQITSSHVFLDIRDQISRRGNEEGLIGLAFHPNFKINGQFFVHYSSSIKDQTGIVARFKVKADDPNSADPDSEEVILQQSQPYRNHNGGSIEFGPDGYLYISFGDGGSANDPQGNAQNLSNWLGAILRIDIDRKDQGLAYAVPADNPFVGQKDVKPELWAVGIRNAWRISFDRKTGDLWAGDVGQDKWDEVDIITRGGNYGWNRYEANADFKLDTELAIGTHSNPIAAYGRQWGISVTGGYVYRGKKFPELDGSYFYGDYASGNLWRISKDRRGEYQNELVRRTGRSIASFGEDNQGELFLLSFDGGIYRIAATDEPEDTFANWPELLSETGLFASMENRKMKDNAVPYYVNAPFWSDGAEKSRFLVLPPGKKIRALENESWQLPIGTTIVKTFEGKHFNRAFTLETRLIKRTAEGWESATYVWDLKQTDARLHPEGQQFEYYYRPSGQSSWQVGLWHAPSASECANCHVDAAGYVLGLNTAQLNRNIEGTDKNQIQAWAEQGILALPDGFDLAGAAKFVDPADETAELETRARVMLDVNCAMCHRPDGPGNANIDLRYGTPLQQTRIIDEVPAQGNLGMTGSKIVEPGHPENSLLHFRMKTQSEGRMPNVGTNRVDQQAIELLGQWIKSLK